MNEPLSFIVMTPFTPTRPSPAMPGTRGQLAGMWGRDLGPQVERSACYSDPREACRGALLSSQPRGCFAVAQTALHPLVAGPGRAPRARAPAGIRHARRRAATYS